MPLADGLSVWPLNRCTPGHVLPSRNGLPDEPHSAVSAAKRAKALKNVVPWPASAAW